jgi:hypothetical protein
MKMPWHARSPAEDRRASEYPNMVTAAAADKEAATANRPRRGSFPAGPLKAPDESINYLLMVAAPTMHTASSCEPVPPEQPIAPMILPSSISGMPPRDAMTSSSVRM